MDVLFGTHWTTNAPPESDPHHRLLISQGSLTELIKARCRSDFSVRVLRHEIRPATELTGHEMQLPTSAPVLYREVLLCDGSEARVFAASILPLSALTGRFAPLQELGARPLGHWIFSEPQLTRRQMHYTQLASDHALFADIRLPTTLLLRGRKTLFAGASKDFLVAEFFL